MKLVFSICFIFFLFIGTALSTESGNYIIIINGDSVRVNLDMEYTFEDKFDIDDEVKVKLIQPATLVHEIDAYKFSYDRGLSVSCTDIDPTVSQCMLVNTTGTTCLIQHYESIDPSMLNLMMLNEVTKESVSYGYEIEREEFKKTLKSGHEISGYKATLTYKGDKEEYIVCSYGGKDEGLLIMVSLISIDGETDQYDLDMIDKFFDTLEVKM